MSSIFLMTTHWSVLHIFRGQINAAQQRPLRQSPIIHSYTASGHTKAVLSVFATDDLLFSSSKGKCLPNWSGQIDAKIYIVI